MATTISVSASGSGSGSTGALLGSRCAHCPMRALAEKHPQHFLTRLWRRRWHNKLCPGWRVSRRAMGKAG